MAERYRTVLLFGPPGSGKGTQGKILGYVPGFRHFAAGDMFRGLDPNSDLGRTFRSYSSKGELVPDDLTVKLWKQTVDNQATSGMYKRELQLLVLDGIPRSVAQTRLMSQLIDVLAVVHLVCRDRDALVQRLKRRALLENRHDDAREDVVRRRLDVYDAETRPVLECYPEDLIHDIEAEGSPASVLARILAVLAPIQERTFPNALGG